jgi:hypothetical protein
VRISGRPSGSTGATVPNLEHKSHLLMVVACLFEPTHQFQSFGTNFHDFWLLLPYSATSFAKSLEVGVPQKHDTNNFSQLYARESSLQRCGIFCCMLFKSAGFAP